MIAGCMRRISMSRNITTASLQEVSDDWRWRGLEKIGDELKLESAESRCMELRVFLNMFVWMEIFNALMGGFFS
jgi:hypothetical protein